LTWLSERGVARGGNQTQGGGWDIGLRNQTNTRWCELGQKKVRATGKPRDFANVKKGEKPLGGKQNRVGASICLECRWGGGGGNPLPVWGVIKRKISFRGARKKRKITKGRVSEELQTQRVQARIDCLEKKRGGKKNHWDEEQCGHTLEKRGADGGSNRSMQCPKEQKKFWSGGKKEKRGRRERQQRGKKDVEAWLVTVMPRRGTGGGGVTGPPP